MTMTKYIDGEEESIRFKRLREEKKTITFVVTQDCNFRCKYCYMTHKHNKGKMSFDVAKKAIDYFLCDKIMFPNKDITWEFIGGEPLLEVDLIEKIIEYILIKTFELNHPWFETSYFGISSNGSLYGTAKVRNLLNKYKNNLEIGITIDGPEHVHNIERQYSDGRGTYGDVIKNIKSWLSDYPNASTKVTFSHNNLKYIVDSVLHLFSIGIKTVNSNLVFENVWEEGDDVIFEEQLEKLGEEIINKDLYNDYTCSFFSRDIGKKLEGNYEQTWCGTGSHMVAVDSEGLLYPCVRFMGFSLSGNNPPLVIGNVNDGIDKEKLMPFINLIRTEQSDDKCIKCEIPGGCAWCKGLDYDDSKNGSIFHRATYICKMHQARASANLKYWKKLDNKIGQNSINGPPLIL